jgi:RHS repeat-associated protein
MSRATRLSKPIAGPARLLATTVFVTLIASVGVKAQAQSAPPASIQPRAVTPGASAGGGGPTAVPSLFNGALTYAIPIQVTPGRQDMQPDLSIHYRSDVGNGWLGVGWALDLGSISRSLRNGTPDYSADDYDMQEPAGTSSLVAASTASEFRKRIESDYERVVKKLSGSSQYFEVTDRKGVRFTYGGTPDSRQADPSNSAHVFRWFLSQIRDVDGNYLNISYHTTLPYKPSEVYPSSITYTGHESGVAPTNSVDFIVESRPDQSVSKAAGFSIVTTQRLARVEIKANGKLQRAYRLAYAVSPTTNRSMLVKFEQFGSDAQFDATGMALAGTPLPAATFGQTAGGLLSNTAVAGPLRTFPNDMNGAQEAVSRVRTGDFNGDGKADLLFIEGVNGTFPMKIYLATATGFAAPINGPSLSVGSDHNGVLEALARVKLGDFNGDGRTDIAIINGFNATQPMSIYFARADGQGFEAAINGPSRWVGNSHDGIMLDCARVLTGDFNGDGKTDLAAFDGYSGLKPMKIYLSNGNGFDASIDGPSLSMPSDNVGTWELTTRIKLGDFNGDGRTDIAIVNGFNSSNYMSIFYARPDGKGFGAAANGPLRWVGGSHDPIMLDCSRVLTGDFNGDGRTDFLTLDGFGSVSSATNIYLSNGAGFDAPIPGPNFVMPSDNPGTWELLSRVRLGDFNGDGVLDLAIMQGYNSSSPMKIYLMGADGRLSKTVDGPVRWSGNSHDGILIEAGRITVGDFNGDGRDDMIGLDGWNVPAPGQAMSLYISSGEAPDLLKTATNGLGGTTTVKYASSTGFANTRLPFPVQTLQALTIDDGNGVVSTTSFGFTGGYYSSGKREFRGFEHVSAVGPSGPDGEQSVSDTWFHQGDDVLESNTPGGEGITAGKPYRERVTDVATGNFREVVTRYWSDLDPGLPYFNPVWQVERRWGKPNNPGELIGRSTLQALWYDSYGNTVREDQYGDAATPDDDVTVVRSFNANTSAWILSAPSMEQIYKGIPATDLIAQTKFYYDGVGNGDCSTRSQSQTPVLGHVTRIEKWLNGATYSDGRTGPDERRAYDALGNLVCVRDAKEHQRSYTYDGSGTFRTSTVSDFLSRGGSPYRLTESSDYYGVDGVIADSGLFGQLKTSRDANSQVTVSKYDVYGRQVSMTFPDLAQRSWDFSAMTGAPATTAAGYVLITSPGGSKAWRYLDGLGREYLSKSKASSSGRVVAKRTFFNPTGSVASTSLPYFDDGLDLPKYSRTNYDSAQRPTKTTAPDGRYTLYCYDDLSGAVASVSGLYRPKSDPNKATTGHRKRELYDVRGKLVEVDEYKGEFAACATDRAVPYAATKYTYDLLGRPRQVIDANANVVEDMDYDTLGRQRYHSTPDLGTWWLEYDDAGNLWRKTDAKGDVVVIDYDSINRPQVKTYKVGTVYSAERTVQYDYDDPAVPNSMGRLTAIRDLAGYASFTFDSLGRTRTQTRINDVDGVSYTLGTEYDAAGRISKVTYPAASGAQPPVATYGYDVDGFLAQVSDGAVSAAASGYRAVGLPAAISYGNGASTAYGFDCINPSDTQCAYRLASIVTRTPAGPPGGSTIVSLGYHYNDTGEPDMITDGVDPGLTTAYVYDELNRLTSAQASSLGSLSYSYDAIGNMLGKEGVVFNYNPVRPHRLDSTATGTTFNYDDNGNMTWDGQRLISYDGDNRPSSVTTGASATTFSYDDEGARVVKETATTRTVFLGPLYECETTKATGLTACTRYVYLGKVRVAAVKSGSVQYFHADHLGTTRAVSDGFGAATLYAYRPYGEATSGVGGVAQLYTGQYRDAETGLYYYGARYYNASLGRFLSPDTVLSNAQDPQALNRYSYVLNNPVFYSDPTGHDPFTILAVVTFPAWGGAALVSGAVVGATWGATWLAASPGQRRQMESDARNAVGNARTWVDDRRTEVNRGAATAWDKAGSLFRSPPRSVYAAHDGAITRMGWESPTNHNAGYGYYVQEALPDGSILTYGHLDPASIAPGIKVGSQVGMGTRMGSYADPKNGFSTGPHLHLDRHLGGMQPCSTYCREIPWGTPGWSYPVGEGGKLNFGWYYDPEKQNFHGGYDFGY